MSHLGSIGAIGGAAALEDRAGLGLAGLDTKRFLDLLITQLLNQDPLNPLENSEIMEQVTQMRNIEASNQLTETLGQFLRVQQLAGASTFIGL